MHGGNSITYLDTFFSASLHICYMVSERIKNKIWNDASKIKGKNPNTWRIYNEKIKRQPTTAYKNTLKKEGIK